MPPDPSELLAERITHAIAVGNSAALKRLLARHNFADVAEVLENNLSLEALETCFQYFSVGQAAHVLMSLSRDRQIACLAKLPVNLSGQILRFMPSDDAVDILQDLGLEQSQKILGEMPFDIETRTIHHLMMEAPDTAAGVMSTDFLKIDIEATVGEAMQLVQQAEEKDFVYYSYVSDSSGKLLGVVSLKQLIRQPETTLIQQIVHFDVKSVQMSDDQEQVANIFRKYYNFLAIPVVDNDNVLKGIITLDDILEIIDEESSEDIYLASGIQIETMDEKNLLTGPVVKAVKARMPWLVVTMAGELMASAIIAQYQHTVASAVIAISFMSLLSGLAGNMGTQSETITVRGLALGLIEDENIWEKVRREMKVGFFTGGVLGLSVGVFSWIMYRHWGLSLLLFGTIITSLCISALLGMLIPYGFQKYFKQDPAGVGGPMITTLLDILTFSAYLYILTLFLHSMI